MTSEKKRQSIVQVISSSIAAATAGSLIKASFKFEASAFTASGKCATDFSTADELRIGQKGNTVVVEILDHGQVVDSSPSGRFILEDGKSMVIENGTVVGGDVSKVASFAMFALLRSDVPECLDS